MIDVQNISVIIAAVSVVFAVITWFHQNRENRKVQQTRLFMDLWDKFDNQIFWDNFYEIRNRWNWKNLDNFLQKYGRENNPEAWTKFLMVNAPWERIGILVRDGIISPKLVNHWIGGTITSNWERIEPIVKEYRDRYDFYTMFEWYEDLYYQLKKCQKEDKSHLQERINDRIEQRKSLEL